jgi:DNA-binding beta-propeller fold protein YncE
MGNMVNSRILGALLAGTLGAAALVAQSGTLLVLSKADQTLSVVDPATMKVLARMPSGPDPHEVVASADGKTAYISNYGGGAYNTISVVDLVAQKALPAIDLGPLHGPHGLDFAAGKVWFTAESNKIIGSYDPASRKIDWLLGTGQNRTHMVYVFPDATHLITSNVNSATMSLIEKLAGGGGRGPGPGPGGPPPNGRGPGPGGPPPGRGPQGSPQGDWDETVVPVGRGAEGFDVSPDGKELWAANATDGTISIVDLSGKRVVQTLPANVTSANRLKFTLDGKLVFVSLLNAPDLVILDAKTRQEVKRVKIGRGAAGILMEPGGARAFVACTPDDYVTIIDMKKLEVAGHLDAGKQPDGMAWAKR